MRVLPDTEKLEFVSKSVSWIEGRDISDSCFILNFGYEAPLPWPQVTMKLADEESERGLQLVSGSQGMNVPSACTIVIIAGFRFKIKQHALIEFVTIWMPI